jgi:hypothetical protein
MTEINEPGDDSDAGDTEMEIVTSETSGVDLEAQRPAHPVEWQLVASGMWSEDTYHSGHIAYFIANIRPGEWLMEGVERNAQLDDVTEEDVEEGCLNDDQIQAMWGMTLEEAQNVEYRQIVAACTSASPIGGVRPQVLVRRRAYQPDHDAGGTWCVCSAVPVGSSSPMSYREAILAAQRIGQDHTTAPAKIAAPPARAVRARRGIPIFGLLRKLHDIDALERACRLLAVQVAWARDPLFRATTHPYWTQAKATASKPPAWCRRLKRVSESVFRTEPQNRHRSTQPPLGPSPATSPVAQTRSASESSPLPWPSPWPCSLGELAGYHGAAVFSNPWCRLLDLAPTVPGHGQEAHRAGLLNLRAVGEVVELSFPLFADFQGQPA